jgi:hypothetical protein
VILLVASVASGADRRALVALAGESNAQTAALDTAVAVGAVDLAAVTRSADADLATAGGAEEEAMGVGWRSGVKKIGPRHMDPVHRRGLDRPAATADTSRRRSP